MPGLFEVLFAGPPSPPRRAAPPPPAFGAPDTTAQERALRAARTGKALGEFFPGGAATTFPAGMTPALPPTGQGVPGATTSAFADGLGTPPLGSAPSGMDPEMAALQEVLRGLGG